MDNLSPTHPDVAPVLHLLDACEVCGGSGAIYWWGRNMACQACNRAGEAHSGKALHPDRVVGALRRWLLLNAAEGALADLTFPSGECRVAAGMNPVLKFSYGGESDRALAYCRAARAVLEAANDAL